MIGIRRLSTHDRGQWQNHLLFCVRELSHNCFSSFILFSFALSLVEGREALRIAKYSVESMPPAGRILHDGFFVFFRETGSRVWGTHLLAVDLRTSVEGMVSVERVMQASIVLYRKHQHRV